MITKYYLPLDSKSLAHYFGGACILPSRYMPNKPADIQNRFDDYLLITSYCGTKEADCCIELVIRKDELNDLLPLQDGFFLFNKPLPITRAKKILFTDENQKQSTVTNINMSTAFIPEQIISVIEKFDDIQVNNLERLKDLPIKDWSSQIKKYNSLLGGFALMRLGGEKYMNYSENYFSSLATYSLTIDGELSNVGKQFKNLFNDPTYRKALDLIQKEVSEDDLYQIASEEKQKILKDNITKIIDLSSLKDVTLIIAVLAMFGVGEEARRKKIDGLILSNFKNEIQPERSEIIALCYGLNRGYSVFSNKYKAGDIEKTVKFELNSQLDYYTIESLYQYSFNNLLKNEEFPYLDDWCPTLDVSNSVKKKNNYQILDVLVVGKKKPKVSSGEYMGNLLRQYFQKETEGYFKDFLDRIRTTITNDLSEEFNEEISVKDNEIKRLRNEQNKVLILESEVNRLQIENANLRKNPKGSEGSVQKQSFQPDSIKEPHTNYNKTHEEGSIANDSSLKQNTPDSDSKKNAKHKGSHSTKVKEQDHEKPLKKTSNKDNTLFDSNKE